MTSGTPKNMPLAWRNSGKDLEECRSDVGGPSHGLFL